MKTHRKSTILICGLIIYLCIFISCGVFLLNGSANVAVDKENRIKPLITRSGTDESDADYLARGVSGEAEEKIKWKFECNCDVDVSIYGSSDDDATSDVDETVSEDEKKDSGTYKISKGEEGRYNVQFYCTKGDEDEIKLKYEVIFDEESTTLPGIDPLLIIFIIIVISAGIGVFLLVFFIIRSNKRKKDQGIEA